MKKSRYFIVGVHLFFVLQCFSSSPDEWSGPKESILLSNWSVNLSLGLSSYYGDLSQYDRNFTSKLLRESKPAYGIKLTKHIRSLSVSGQVIYGGFKSAYRPEHSFETRLLEYSVQAGLELISLFIPSHSKKYGLEVFAGTGQFIFTTSISIYNDGLQLKDKTSTGTPEFVYFIGGGAYMNIAEGFRLTTELSIRQVQNDNIDKFLKNGDFDYYSLLNIGITYVFGNVHTRVRDEARQKINKGRPTWRVYE